MEESRRRSQKTHTSPVCTEKQRRQGDSSKSTLSPLSSCRAIPHYQAAKHQRVGCGGKIEREPTGFQENPYLVCNGSPALNMQEIQKKKSTSSVVDCTNKSGYVHGYQTRASIGSCYPQRLASVRNVSQSSDNSFHRLSWSERPGG